MIGATKSRLVLGARVRVRSVPPDALEYDEGTIVFETADGMLLVRWEEAGVTYAERRADLEPVPTTPP